MLTRHRLCQFRKSKHVLHQRFRSRIFYRDIMAVADLKKPFVVVLTGAGISAESGIRTFCTANRQWEQHCVEDIATLEGYQRNPVLVQEFYNARRRQLQAAEVSPNSAHLALADLEAWMGENFLLVTQNIDNLHERVGNKRVLHMHGELLKVRCTHSGQVFDWPEDLSVKDRCHCCKRSATLRPHVVWLGEMPLGMDEIYQALTKADFFIAIGTSGHFYPAASFVQEARLAGAYTMELNLEPSQIENQFNEKHYGLASEVVPHFVHKFLVGKVARADRDLPNNLSY